MSHPSATPHAPEEAGRPTLSVILITYNAERLLERVLDSVRWADEIVVVDRGSTDATESIARRFTPHFHVREWEGFGVQKQRALELATGEWVLSIDADEVVTPELRQAVERCIAEPGGHAGFTVTLHTCFGGRWFGSRGWRVDRKLRLFRRDVARFSLNEVHEGVHLEGTVGRVSGTLLHFSYRDIAHHVEKMNQYSSAMARRLHARGRRSGPAAPVLRGIARFLRDYLAGGDFLYGRAGLLRSALAGYYAFLTYAKLWELQLRQAECGPTSEARVDA